MLSATDHQVRDHLCQDHARLEGFLQAVLAAFDAEDPTRIASAWSRFESELLTHLDAEERFLIPALFRMHQREARALLEEHRHIRARLTELRPGGGPPNAQARAVGAFIHELCAHGRHEDNVLYRWADDNVEDPDRQSLLQFLNGTTLAPPPGVG